MSSNGEEGFLDFETPQTRRELLEKTVWGAVTFFTLDNLLTGCSSPPPHQRRTPVTPATSTAPEWIGMNYGHQYQPDDFSLYQAQVSQDFQNMKKWGINTIRIAFPVYNGPVGVLMCQKMVEEALVNNLNVIWGVTISGGITAEVWKNFKGFMTGTIAPWAKILQSKRFELQIGNEEEGKAQQDSITSDQIQKDIQGNYAEAMRSIYTGSVSYAVSGENIRDNTAKRIHGWLHTGKGNLGRVSFNMYYDFQDLLGQLSSVYGDSFYLSECNYHEGYTGNEDDFNAKVTQLAQLITISGVKTACYFCWRGGSFGVPPEKWDISLPGTKGSNLYRLALTQLVDRKRFYDTNPKFAP